MHIATRLTAGFVAIAVLTGVASLFGVSLSDHIWNLRHVEMPMENHLGQLEESLWQAIHAVDTFVANADPRYIEHYKAKAAAVDVHLAAYVALTDTEEEKAMAAKFGAAWSSAKANAENVLALVGRCKEAEDRLFEYVDKADDVIDFQVQEHFSPTDPALLAKERAVREVEVSLWEAIHAAQQFTGLTPHISRADHAQKTFAELMEKQFDDVKEFWGLYTALPLSTEERKAVADFDALWARAVTTGRDVVKLSGESRRQFDALQEQADALDDTIDAGMRAYVTQRVAARDEAASRARAITVTLGLAAIMGAIAIGLLMTRSICRPVARLRDATVELAKGNLGHRIRTLSKDEIGAVSAAFDRMAEQLQASTGILEEQVAHRTAAEGSLRQANADLTGAMARLSQVNEELKEFVYIASHDLREPLRKVSSFGGLLKDSLGPNLGEDDRENLMFMIDGASRMTQMVEGLLTYSRVNTSEPVRSVVDLNEAVRELECLDLGTMIEEAAAVIEVPQPLPKVVGNPAQISQLLQNLIANGIKYGRDGIRPRIVITADGDVDGDVRISVRDNGIGILPEHYENIFKMFRRLHSRRKYPGTGIGLTVCKRIVERHGGRIGVESCPGQGTTFWFTLHGAGAAAEAEVAEAVASA